MYKLPFGLRGDQLLHISEVEPGLACNCVCPSCGHTLVARKGDQNAHHFAHERGTECAHGVETALHLAAKQLLETENRIRLPAVWLPFNSNKPAWLIQPERFIQFDDVRLESSLGSIVPDILVTVKQRPLLIEITVTHAVDEAKLQKIRLLDMSVLEIRLRDFSRTPTLEELSEELIFATRNKQWLYNARVEAIRRQVLEHCEAKPIQQRGLELQVDDCPIKAQHPARVVADCFSCPFCVDTSARVGSNSVLLCAGRKGIATFEDLLKISEARVP